MSSNSEPRASRCLIVTRHPGLVDWLRKRHGISGELRDNLLPSDIESLGPGDRVIGPLPLHVVAALTQRGVQYDTVDMDVPADRRGRELSEQDMDVAGARLRRYMAHCIHAGVHDDLMGLLPRPSAPTRASRSGWWNRRKAGTLAFFFAAGFVILSSWAFQALYDAVGLLRAFAVKTVASINWVERLAEAVIALVVLYVSVIFAAGFKNRFLHATFTLAPVVPKRVLVLALSRMREPETWQARLAANDIRVTGLPPAALRQAQENAAAALTQLPEEERAGSAQAALLARIRDALALAEMPWQQNLRAIRAHLASLEHVIVIPSRETWDLFDTFKAGATAQIAASGRSVRVERHGRPNLSYEMHDDVLSALRLAIEHAKEAYGIEEGDIAIDATGGPKPFSIAAALATINRKVVMTYINNEGVASSYDGKIAVIELN